MIGDWMDALLNADWLHTFISFLMQVLMSIVGIVLLPFSLMLKSTFPGFDGVLTALVNVMDLATQYIGWIVSAFAIPGAVLSMVVAYYTFAVGARFSVFLVKLTVKWIRSFK